MGNPTPKKKPKERILHSILRLALQLICALDRDDGAEVSELAVSFGKHRDTIHAYLNTMEEIGLPLEVVESDGRSKRYKMSVSGQLSKLANVYEMSHFLVASVGSPALSQSKSMNLSRMDLADKIAMALGSDAKTEMLETLRCIHASARRTWSDTPPDVFWPVIDGIRGQRLIQLTYKKKRSKPPKVYELLPQRWFTGNNGGLYLLSWSPEHKSVRVHQMHKMKFVKVLDQRGETPLGFDPDKLIDEAFDVFMDGPRTRYQILYSAAMEEFLYSRIWHKSQKIKRLKDGRFSLTFTCGETPEVLAFVRSCGRECQIVAPLSARWDMYDTWTHWSTIYPKPRGRRPVAKDAQKKEGPPEDRSGEPSTALNTPEKPG